MTGRYSIRTAIKESIPSACITMDILEQPIPDPPRRSRVAVFACVVSNLILGRTTHQRIKIDSSGNNNFVALMGTLQ
eukprot:2377986-Rhodomonas_salina.1